MKKLFAIFAFLLTLSSPALATIAMTAAGISSSTSGATDVVNSSSTGAANIPANSIILVFVTDGSTSGSLSAVNDNAGNTYAIASQQPLANSAGVGTNYIYWSYTGNAVALTGAGTITYTKNASGSRVAMSVAYVTGSQLAIGALDGAVTASAGGPNSGTVTVTSGLPTVAGELFVYSFGNTNSSTFTLDTGNGWAVPPTRETVSTFFQVAGGNQVNAGTGTETAAPTLGTKNSWAIQIIGLKPAVAASTPFIFVPATIP